MARTFSVIVSINAAGARKGGREFKQGADQVARSSQKMTRSMNTSRRSATALITTIGRIRGVATLAFAGFLGVGGIAAVVKTIAQFESSMKRVEALLGDRAVGGAMSALTDKARELGATTAFTATQAAEGMGFLTQAGFDALETFQAIEPALQLAQAGMLGLGEAADIVSNIMQGFKIEAAETQRVVDALAFVATRSNTSIRQLGEAMKFVAPVAGAVGLSIEETAAALGLLGNSGLQASLAGTSLRRVLSGLLNPSKEATKIFEKMGLESEELVAALSDPQKGLTFVIKALEDAGLGAAAAFTLFGQRGAPGLLSLIGQTDDLEKFNKQLENVEGTARDIGTTMLDSLGGDARIAVSVLQEAIIRLGEAGLREWLRDVTDAFAGFIRGISDQEQVLEGASEKVKKWNKAGIAMRENVHLLRKALVLLVVYMQRAMLAAFASGAIALAKMALLGFQLARTFGIMGAAGILLTTQMTALRAAIIATGVGALVVVTALLLDWILFSKDAEAQNEKTSASFDRQQSVISDLAFHYNRLTFEERKTAIALLETNLEQSNAALINRTQALHNAEVGAMKLEAAQTRLAAADQAVLDVSRFIISMSSDQFTVDSASHIALLEKEQATLQVAEATALLNSATGASIQELGALRAEIEKNELRLRAWKDVQNEVFKTVEEAIAAYNKLRDANEAYSEDLLEQTGLSQTQAVQLKALRDEYGKNEAKIEELESALETLNIAAKNTPDALAELGTSLEEVAMLTEETEFKIRKLEGTLKPFEKAAEKMSDKIAKIRAEEDKVKLAIVEHTIAQRELTREMIIAKVPAEEQAEILAILEKLHRKNIEALEAECDATDELEECMSESAKAMETLWDQALRNIQDAFADAFMGAFDSFEDFADSLLDAFKTLVANILAEAAILNLFGGGNGFFKDVFTGLSRGFGGGGGVAGSVGSTVGGAASGAGTGGISGMTAAFGGFTASVGAFFTGAGSFLSGAGSLASGVSSGAVTSGVSVFNTGAQNAAIANPTTFTAGGAVAGAGVGALTGAVTDAILGGRGDPTRNAIFSAIGGAIGSIWGPIGSVVGGAIGSFVDNLFGGAKKLESAVIELGVQGDNFFGTQTDIVSKQKSFFRGKKYTTTITNMNEALNEIEGVFKALGMALEDGAEALGANASGFLDDFSAQLNLNIKNMTAAQITAQMTAFFERTMSAAITEWLNDVEDLSDDARTILTSFRGTVEGFVIALDSLGSIENLFNLDLVDTVTDAVAESQVGIFEAYQSALSGYREIIASYDGSIESIELLTNATAVMIQVQLDLVAIYISTGEAISNMFTSSADQIREALLSEEELYAFRQQQIDDLIMQAQMTTDPEELARLAEAINALGLDAFNMLDEDQRDALGPEFIEFFEMLDDLFGGQIEEGIDSVIADQAALDEEVSTRMLEAAEAILEAARLLAQQAQIDADRDFLTDDRFGGDEQRA